MERSKIRRPVVAGRFYSLSAQKLKEEIGSLVDEKAKKADIIAAVLPHAGYMYSGRVAAATVSRLNIKDKVILLGPNHTGLGANFSIVTSGTWQTPLGELEIDSGLAGEILRRSEYLEEDDLAHREEHSLEVLLPFLQYFRKDFRIVPILFMSDEVGVLKKIGQDIAGIIKAKGIEKSVLLLASSDMTHYEPEGQAQKKDRQAIEAILELDEDKLMDRVLRQNISMCGFAPVIAMICAAKALGAQKSELIKYQTSGDVTQDKSSVVGYAGIIIHSS